MRASGASCTVLYFILSLRVLFCIGGSEKVVGNSFWPTWLQFNTTNIFNREVKEKSNLVRISYINGIFHSKEDFLEVARDIESVFKNKVHGFYLPSTGSWTKDFTQAAHYLYSKSQHIELAKNLSTHLKSLLSEVAPNGRVLHIAHSAGAIITYLAARYHLTREEKSRIDVITFGGGRSITRKYFPGRLVNYYSQNDPLVLVDFRAGRLIRKGANWLWGKAEQITHEWRKEVNDRKHNTSFVFLAGKAGNPIKDHSLNGPTYLAALTREAEAFHQRLSDLIRQEAKKSSAVRHMRKSFARVTGQHHFWSNVSKWIHHRGNSSTTSMNTREPIRPLRPMRKMFARITGWHHFWKPIDRNTEVNSENIGIETNMNEVIDTILQSEAERQAELLSSEDFDDLDEDEVEDSDQELTASEVTEFENLSDFLHNQ